MIDPTDKVTLPLIPQPARRGRPPTGKAMTAAQRKREQRRRVADMVAWGTETEFEEWLSIATPAQLAEILPSLFVSHPMYARDVATKLLELAEFNLK